MEKEINSLQLVSVERQKLLEIVKENKAKHDQIYDAAVSGYNAELHNWLGLVKSEAERIVGLSQQYSAKEVYDKPFAGTGIYSHTPSMPSFPENHADDYIKTIKKLELTTAETISLNDSEFSQYVLNNWKWKEQFVSSSLTKYGYLTGFAGVRSSGAALSF